MLLVARPALLFIGLTVALPACQPPCEETCRRVAVCKQGDRMLGEGKMPADPKCLDRCQAAPPDFAPCEGKYRDCKSLLACLPY